jgi:hypothetical protein
MMAAAASLGASESATSWTGQQIGQNSAIIVRILLTRLVFSFLKFGHA